MEKPRSSTIAWTGLAAGVYLYDRYCEPNEMLSERADEWMVHPIKKRLFQAAVIGLGLHLTNAINPRYDVFAHVLREKDTHE
jgi:hypothetical protein